MRNILFCVFLLLVQTFLGQNIPQIESNLSEEDLDKSVIHLNFDKDFQTLIIYTHQCYWSNEDHFFVCRFLNSEWDFFKWEVKFKSSKKTIKNIKRIRKRKIKNLSKEKFDELISVFVDKNFFNFSNDSLNVHEIFHDDGTVEYLSITDGCADKFEIYTSFGQREIYSYMADEFQKKIPNKQRGDFIFCRNKFLKFFKE